MSDPRACQCRRCYLHGRDACPRVAAEAELTRMKARPAEAEFGRLDSMWNQLVRERDTAMAKLEKVREEVVKVTGGKMTANAVVVEYAQHVLAILDGES